VPTGKEWHILPDLWLGGLILGSFPFSRRPHHRQTRRSERHWPDADCLPDHLRRDIGLQPLPHVAVRDLML